MKSSCLALAAFLLSLLGLSGQAQNVALRPGDTITMRLFGAPADYTAEFAGEYTIAIDGTVGVPEIGAVNAAGLTATQLARSIQTQLVQMKIFTRPVVEIIVPGAGTITVRGEVRVPSVLQWIPDMTLLSAIDRAGRGGFSGPGKVKVRRAGKVTMYNLKKVDKDPTQNPKLMPGDEVDVGGEN